MKEKPLPNDRKATESYIRECASLEWDYKGRHFTNLVMERVYAELDFESRDAGLSPPDLASILIDSGLQLALIVLEKFQVIEAAIAYATTPHDPLSSPIMNSIGSEFPTLPPLIRLKHLSTYTVELCARYRSLAFSDHWILLSILSHSLTFRLCARILTRHYWTLFTQRIKQNAISIEIFGKVRGLNFRLPLQRVSGYVPITALLHWTSAEAVKPAIKPGSPHSYIVTEKWATVAPPMFEGRVQINIERSIYHDSNMLIQAKPPDWPTNTPWPSDPQLRPPGLTCYLCHSAAICACDPLTHPLILRPLIELNSYGSKGVGIRLLQPIPAGSILAEYVGLITTIYNDSDPDYAMAINPPGTRSRDEIALMVAKEFGNWTRFINHSCNPATYFRERVIGGRTRLMVEASRDVEMFEEVTVHYGRDYWIGRDCECGEDCCDLSREHRIRVAKLGW